MTADRSGTQSIGRAVAVLRFLASAGPGGARLAAIASAAGITKATAHRVLAALLREGLAEQDPLTRNYQIGTEVLSLVPTEGHRFVIQRLAGEAVASLARRTGDTAFLTIRSGMEALCLDRVDGDRLVQPHIMSAGSRWPLGVGAGSLALLAALGDQEVEGIVAYNLQAYRRFGPGFTQAGIMDAVARTRIRGYAVNDGQIVSALVAVGVAVFDDRGRPLAALSVAAIRDRMSPARLEELVVLLREEANALRARLRPSRSGL